MLVECYWWDNNLRYFHDVTENCTNEEYDLIVRWFIQEKNAGRIHDYKIYTTD